MKKANQKRSNDLRPEYDFAAMKGGVRGKYLEQLRESSNIVLLEPDIAQAFPTEDAVNGALRGLLDSTKIVRRRRKSRAAQAPKHSSKQDGVARGSRKR
jgi:hypothetical protein